MKLADLTRGAVVMTAGAEVFEVVTDVVKHEDGVTFAARFMGRNGAHAMTVQEDEVAGWATYEQVDRWWV